MPKLLVGSILLIAVAACVVWVNRRVADETVASNPNSAAAVAEPTKPTPANVSDERPGSGAGRANAAVPVLEIPTSRIGDSQPAPQAYTKLNPVPRMIEFSGYMPGEELSREFAVFTIEKLDAEPWITGLKRGDAEVTAEVLSNIKEQRHRELAPHGLIERLYTLKLQTRLPHWETAATPVDLTFETAAGMPESTEYVIVVARCEKPIGVAPETIFVGANSLAAGAIDRVIAIRSFDDHELTLKNVTSECLAITASIENQQSASEPARVKVRIAAAPELAVENGHSEANVRIETNYPLLPTLDVAVFIQAGSTESR